MFRESTGSTLRGQSLTLSPSYRTVSRRTSSCDHIWPYVSHPSRFCTLSILSCNSSVAFRLSNVALIVTPGISREMTTLLIETLPSRLSLKLQRHCYGTQPIDLRTVLGSGHDTCMHLASIALLYFLSYSYRTPIQLVLPNTSSTR